MSFRSTVRTLVPAAVLAAAALATAACSTTAAGTAVPAATVPPAVSTPASLPVSPSAPVSPSDIPATPSPSPTSQEPSDSPATPTEEPSEPTEPIEEPTEPTEPIEEPTEPTGPAHPATFDQTTGVWLETMCTDVYGFIGGLSAVPTVVLADGAAEYKQAWLDYFGQNAYNLEVMIGNMAALDPPTLPNGEEVHAQYVAYFEQLKGAAIEGWELIDAAGSDEQEIGDAVDAAVDKVESMSTDDMGMGDLIGPEYKAAMEQIDACAPLISG